ncbi:MAG TPA: DMT family transporter [Firmicutes bacterium]|jgi:drug/metabolite transporter (DMT)-like permease|nr:DMT family transporter [Bacillota bacterium]
MPTNYYSALLLFFIALIWGGSFIIVKESLTVLSPLAVIALRFTLAFCFLFLVYRRTVGRHWRTTLRPGFGLGIILTLAFATQTIGLKFTTPSVSALLTGMNGIFVALLEAFFYQKKPALLSLLGLITATFGLALITWPSSARQLQLNPGVLLTLACALFFAWHIVATSRAVTRYNPQTLTVIQFAVVALTAWCFAPPGIPSLHLKLQTWGALFYLGLLATAIAFLCQSVAQRRITPVMTAVILATEPAFATLFSIVFGYEPLTWKLVLGAFFMISGIILSAVGESFRGEVGKMIP